MHHFGGAPSMLQWCSSRAHAPIVGRAIVGLVTNAAKALLTCFITAGGYTCLQSTSRVAICYFRTPFGHLSTDFLIEKQLFDELPIFNDCIISCSGLVALYFIFVCLVYQNTFIIIAFVTCKF